MNIIEHIKHHYWMTGIIVDLTLVTSNSSVIMSELKKLPFMA